MCTAVSHYLKIVLAFRSLDFQTILVLRPLQKVLLPRLFWGSNIPEKKLKTKKNFAKKLKLVVNSTPSILQNHRKFYYCHFFDKKWWKILLLPFFVKISTIFCLVSLSICFQLFLRNEICTSEIRKTQGPPIYCVSW